VPAGLRGVEVCLLITQELLIALDRDENGTRLVAARDHELLGLALLKSIQSVRKLSRGGPRRQDLIESNAQHEGPPGS
jgi:hypothetical protein